MSAERARALWRLIRGDDQRGRKLRWMAGLLRPYRGRVALTIVAILGVRKERAARRASITPSLGPSAVGATVEVQW